MHAAFGSDNGLSLVRHQAIIWTNDDLLSKTDLSNFFYKNSNIFMDRGSKIGNLSD